MPLIPELKTLELRQPDNGLPHVLCIAGPTASGKTSLAVKAAQLLGGEIISADSMQIYKYMDIGTAKPTAAEQGGIPHHLIDFLEPSEEYSVVQYVEAAKALITDISHRGRVPIIAGGTGQYISALVDNLDFDRSEPDPAIKAEVEAQLAERGRDHIHARLAELDPEAAEQIHPNNVKRVVRALEMRLTTGLTLTERNANSRQRPVFARYSVFGIDVDRAELYARIDRRVDAMITAGLEAEARFVATLHPGRTASQAIGYKEFAPYFAGEATLGEVTELIKKNSRNYAKRQLTWFRRPDWVNWRTADDILSVLTRYPSVTSTS
ncbi:MAG: tRNA (adenosine(37)-N6)-dimethylallyltransferase MiaA [Clostridia bacterium]|nr:tRNA (adenosine(37)-N6)-dimethylallyltransferase MiaA [Clostridia bacterium]